MKEFMLSLREDKWFAISILVVLIVAIGVGYVKGV